MLKPRFIPFPTPAYVAESADNKVTDFTDPDDVTYPTTRAVVDYVAASGGGSGLTGGINGNVVTASGATTIQDSGRALSSLQQITGTLALGGFGSITGTLPNANLDPELSAIAGLTSAANKLPYFTGAGTAALTDLSAFARTFLDDADGTAVRATIGLVIGTNVQAYNAKLAGISGLTATADSFPYFTGASTVDITDLTLFGRDFLGTPDVASARSVLVAAGNDLTTAVFVANAGTTVVNGIYTKRGTSNSKPYYNLLGSTDDTATNSIVWDTSGLYGQWVVNSGIDPYYKSVVPSDTKIQIPGSVSVGNQFNIHVNGAGADYLVIFVNSALSTSSVIQDTGSDAEIHIGISDSPTATQIASKISVLTNTLAQYPYTSVTLTDTFTLRTTFFDYFAPTINVNTAGVTLVSTTVYQDGSATPDLVGVWSNGEAAGTNPTPSVCAIKALDSGLGLVKPAVAVVGSSNLTLSGEQTIDGILTSNSLVLCTAQTTGANNGPWVSNSGAWTRPTWYSTGSTTQAPQFLTTFVRLGTTYSGSTWRMTTAAVTIGTTATTWVQTPVSLASSNVTGTLPAANVSTLNQNTTGSAASLSISGQTGLLTVTGLTLTNRAKTVRDAADTILELGGSYTPTGTWTNLTLVTPALGTPSALVLTNATGSPTGITLTKAQLNTIVSDDDPAYVGTANTFTAAQINSTSGTASTPALKLSGVPFAGTGTTSFPLVYINDAAATASTTLNTAGTYFGVNGDGTQDLMNLLKDGTSVFKVASDGTTTITGTTTISGASGLSVSNNLVSVHQDTGFRINSRGRLWTGGSDGVLFLQNSGGTAPASLDMARRVVNKTGNYTVLNTDSNVFFTNAGAAGTVNFTLPTAAANLRYTFYVDAAQTLTITAGASTTIQLAGSPSAAAGNITSNTVGNCVTIQAISATKWVTESHEGTWTVN